MSDSQTPVPSLPELELAAKKIVWTARKEGNLKRYTPRLVRVTLEKQFHLHEGILDAPEYKDAIKAATKAALTEDSPDKEGTKSPQVEKQPSPVLSKKRKADGTVKADDVEKPKSSSTPKGKGKAKMTEKHEDKEEEEEGSAKKKRKTVAKKKKVVSEENKDEDIATSSSRAKRPQAQKEKTFKSAELVPTSDMEQDEPDPEPTALDKKPKESIPSKAVSNNVEAPKKDATPKQSKNKGPMPSDGDLLLNDSGPKSESELSELTDEPPKQKQSSKSKSEPKEPKKPRAKKEAPTLSKDEEKVKRLKSFVVACGVRKVWSKVFQGLDTPRQQIKKLEEILAELGMNGRMSMDQAKAIKQKREMAKELEDVQAYAKAMEAKDSSRRSVQASGKMESNDADDEEEESDVAPMKRPTNARKSIMAFLQDQSDDE